MVKTKGGRIMNPADAFRKEQRKKEIKRNKMERGFQRDANTSRAKPEDILGQLAELVEQEKVEGTLNKNLRLKKRVLQDAYEVSMKRHKDQGPGDGESSQMTFTGTNAHGHGVPDRRPEDSVYYHPVHNPLGTPPPGKPQRYKTSAGSSAAVAEPSQQSGLPIPEAPPLPAGPRPGDLAVPIPDAPPLPAGPQPGMGAPLPPPPGPPPGIASSAPLPPPPGPPPQQSTGAGPLPPPPGPPPTAATGLPLLPPPGPPPGHRLPPPPGPPPGYMSSGGGSGRLPPPPGPPPAVNRLAPPPGPPPSASAISAATAAGNKREVTKVVSAQTTVIKRPLAQNDRSLTTMVPAALRVKREQAAAKKKVALAPGFGLAPQLNPARSAPSVVPAAPAPAKDQSYSNFMEEMERLGAFQG